jgi:hypothetical protein
MESNPDKEKRRKFNLPNAIEATSTKSNIKSAISPVAESPISY